MKRVSARKKKSNSRNTIIPKIILIIVCILGVTSGIIFLALRYFNTAEIFAVKDSDYFSGKNIFKVNLKREANRLNREARDCKRVVLKRQLPDRIIVDFESHQAVAKVQLSDYFFVDEEGVLFDQYPHEKSSQLPLIIGLEKKIPYPRTGAKHNEATLQETLAFINGLNENKKISQQLKIKEMDVTNVNNVVLLTTTRCRINLGDIYSLENDLLVLAKLTKEINFDLTQVEYIDLRFQEPVVKYRK